MRPLFYLTLWANYQLGGLAPFGYLLTNWMLHLASVWLCARLLSRLLPAGAALLATAIFALHPLQTESIAYVFARSTLLASFCSLAALDCWTRGRRWWAVPLAALALLAKEEAVALPVVILLLDSRTLLHAGASRSTAWRPLAAIFALALAVGARGLIVTTTQAGTGAAASAGIAPLDYLATQSFVLARYAAGIVAPVAINFDPDITPWSRAAGALLWLPWLALIAWCLHAAFRPGAATSTKANAARWTLAAFAILAPTSTILPIEDLSADRRLYLALLAIGAALGTALSTALNGRRSRQAAYALIALLAIGTTLRVPVWRTELSLWSDTVAKSPAKPRPRVQLARAVPPAEALRILEGATGPLADTERGRVLLELGRPADALQVFGKVLAARPGDPGALTNRGAALAALGLADAAREDFERALQSDPCYAPALRNLRRAPCAGQSTGVSLRPN